MSDLISRQDAIDAISAILDNPNHAEFLYGDEICKTLQDLPSAERRGRWEFNIDDEEWSWNVPFKCTQCGGWNNRETPYCPHCGAKMIEPQESEDKE